VAPAPDRRVLEGRESHRDKQSHQEKRRASSAIFPNGFEGVECWEESRKKIVHQVQFQGKCESGIYKDIHHVV
jgi:hypothetical protein